MLSIILLCFLFIQKQGFSQQEIVVEQIKEKMSKGEQSGFMVVIPQANLDDVNKAWKKQLQQGVKSKAEEVGHEIHIHGALAPEIYPNPIDIYSLLTDVDSSIHLVSFFEIDSNLFFDPDSYPDRLVSDKIFNGIQNYLGRFAVDQYKLAVQNELKTEENMLRELDKQMDFLKKEQEKMEKSIKEEEQNITAADDEIKILNSQKEQYLKQIEEKRVSSAYITDKEVQKEAKKELKSLEKERDKIDNKLEKMEKSKVSSKNLIDDHEKAIEKNLEDQQELSQKIEHQELVISQVEQKLNGIK
jgi:hypothetical protein